MNCANCKHAQRQIQAEKFVVICRRYKSLRSGKPACFDFRPRPR